MAGRRTIYMLSLIGCVVFFFANQQWFSWYALITVICLPLFSLLVSLLAIFTTLITPDLPKSVPIATEQPFSIRCDSLLPTPPYRYKCVVQRPITAQQWVLSAGNPLPTAHCGGLICTIQKPRIYDYLGLFSFKLKPPCPRTVLVYPEPIPMKLPSLTKFRSHSYRPKWGGGFAEDHELRQYVPGDNVRHIHWKLSAKTGSLILRQPMEPQRHRLLLQLDLCGTAEDLDRKLGRLLWVGQTLLAKKLPFTLQASTGQGLCTFEVTDIPELHRMMDTLLCAPCVSSDTPRSSVPTAHWLLYIGGEPDEA